MKDIILLGATGSIGTQTLDIIRMNKEKYNLIALSVGRDLELSSSIIEEFEPKFVATRRKEDKEVLSAKFPHIDFVHGDSGLVDVATYDSMNKNVTLVVALVGTIGLVPTVEAIKLGRNIALANKETLVTAGEIVMDLAKKHNVTIFPIDSEHSAIYQALVGENKNDIKNLIITASGGSFRHLIREELVNVTKEDALKHPNWNMGAKITIDSSTMMNKGFEVIEAEWLFGVRPEQIQVVVHPQSVIHSAVQFEDGAVKAQLGVPDMRLPIQYAFSFPKRLTLDGERLDLFGMKDLTFEQPDVKRFRCLGLAYESLKQGGNMPCIVNAANEVANRAFINDQIGFEQIANIIEQTMQKIAFTTESTLETYLQTDKEARVYASTLI